MACIVDAAMIDAEADSMASVVDVTMSYAGADFTYVMDALMARTDPTTTGAVSIALASCSEGSCVDLFDGIRNGCSDE